jgi:HEPN domain-containing protein
VLHEDLCFDAQQAAEKAIKAVLVNRSVEFPKTHSIVDLLSLAYQSGQNIPDQIRQAGVLTRYAVETRYPGLAEPPSKEDYQRAVTLAEQVVRWAENLISSEHPK